MIVDIHGSVASWPRCARLRFKVDAPLKPKYRYLCGTDVIVIGTAQLCSPNSEKTMWDVRQLIWSYAFGADGRARPEDLEPRPDDPNKPTLCEVAKVLEDKSLELYIGVT